jgi:hypothetical protein
MMAHWTNLLQHLPDHLPFVISATRAAEFGDSGSKLDVRSLVTALIISVSTALASSWATTRDLSTKFDFIAKQLSETAAKVEQLNESKHRDMQAVSERLTRIETMNGMGMSGEKRSKRE